MSLRRVKTIFKSPKEDIFDFNHICPTMDQETLQTVTDFYRFYHKKLWCAKRAFKKFKRLNLALTMSSTGFVALGAILGGVTLNPFILGVVSGAGLALKTFQEIKDPKKKIEMTRFVVTNYEKVLIRKLFIVVLRYNKIKSFRMFPKLLPFHFATSYENILRGTL